jgi:DNA-binding PadR family transcriptional regulator
LIITSAASPNLSTTQPDTGKRTAAAGVSALSKHLSTLEQAGYIRIRKINSGRRRYTHLQLTRQGRAAFEAHASALQALIAAAKSAPPKPGP